jgi:threonine/homoserine/homoserine lactone efflux protein
VTFEQAISFAVFSVVAAGTPGPSNTLLTATGAQVGVWRGLPALFGVAAGMGLMMFVVGFGLGTVVLGNPIVLTALKWAGAAVLLWLAWKIATAGVHTAAGGAHAVGFFGAAAFQWVNPKAWLASASAAAAFLSGGESALVQALAFGAMFLLLSIPSCFPWLAFGAVMQRFLRSERTTRVFNGVMGLLLAASVVVMLR